MNFETTAQDTVNYYELLRQGLRMGIETNIGDFHLRIAAPGKADVQENLRAESLLADELNTMAGDAFRAFWASTKYRLSGLVFSYFLCFAADLSDNGNLRDLVLEKIIATSNSWLKRT